MSKISEVRENAIYILVGGVWAIIATYEGITMKQIIPNLIIAISIVASIILINIVHRISGGRNLNER